MRIAEPLGRPALLAIIGELRARNRLTTALIYIQVTRGVAPRDHAFPPAGTRPALVVTMRRMERFPLDSPAGLEGGLAGGPAIRTGAAITLADQRWARCDIKSIGLLPNVLAKQAAREQVTEGASTSVWMVDEAGVLRTRALSTSILPGCTRAALIDELAAAGIVCEQRPFALAELRRAREIFVTSATSFVKPILRLYGAAVGDGAVGPVARRLFDMLIGRMVEA